MTITESTPAHSQEQNTASELTAAAQLACKRLPPLWPLQRFVAVNPFVGLSRQSFPEACQLMRRMVPGGMQMPLSYYREQYEAGNITDQDLKSALQELPACEDSLDELQATLTDDCTEREVDGLISVAEAADRTFGTAWQRDVTDAISQFCAAYFDAGQAAWRLPWRDLPLYAAWREAARTDRGPEMQGLTGFREEVSKLPHDAVEAVAHCLERLGVESASAGDICHHQLLSIRGWAGYIQYLAHEDGLHGRDTESGLMDLLAIRLAFETALLARYDSPALREHWPTLPLSNESANGTQAAYLWQLAHEHAWRRQLVHKIQAIGKSAQTTPSRPAVQAAFCIDVRSEVFRRALEATSPDVETIGFAGFFGMPIEYIPLTQRHGDAQCPVLLAPKFKVRETPLHATPEQEHAVAGRKHLAKRIGFAWNSFKTSAIACFSFVETFGLGFAYKLLRDAFGLASSSAAHDPHMGPCVHDHHPGHGISHDDAVELAAGALRHMGLRSRHARLILLCGHGSQTANNPYAAGLDCGACGGHAGDANARVAAALLNDAHVREGLRGRGIDVPEDTWFVAGLHNTTTDEVSLFGLDEIPASHRKEADQLQVWLKRAGTAARRERAPGLGLASEASGLEGQVASRSRDWSQVRPEWGLAGNAAFIAAPRVRTAGLDLGGRVFLHNYNHQSDEGDATLELIMTAPLVVANWINLQYFASTVNNDAFGSGNKVLHNVVGTLGVCQGNSGDLLTGLPLQSVHDGKRWMHDPLRLHAFIEAPRANIDAILAKHENVRMLVDNAWLLLFAIEDEGGSIFAYRPHAGWSALEA